MSDVEEVVRMRKRLTQAREELATARGGLKELLKRLKAEFGCDSVEQARVKFAELKAKRGSLEEDISAGVARIKKEFGI
jgi:hypothetical protein